MPIMAGPPHMQPMYQPAFEQVYMEGPPPPQPVYYQHPAPFGHVCGVFGFV